MFIWFDLIGCILIILGFLCVLSERIIVVNQLFTNILHVCGIVLILIGLAWVLLIVVPSDEVVLCDTTYVQGIKLDNSTVYYGESFIDKNGNFLNDGDVCVILIGDMSLFARGLPQNETKIIEGVGNPHIKTYQRQWTVHWLFYLVSFEFPRNEFIYELYVPKNSGVEAMPYVNDRLKLSNPLKYVPEGSYLISEFL